MHRDVKAANLLVDDDGTVLLGDLGVAAFLWDREDSPAPQTTKSRIVNFNAGPHPSHRHPHSHSRPQQNPPLHRPPLLGKRKSFVGTPCWMAPEVINGKQYDASADIWSFGITAIELAQGRAPRSRMDPHKVLVMTVTDEPPKLERNTGPNHYSSAFVEVVAMCLTKDPSKRPTAEALLQMSFFKGARKPSYLCSTILRGMPPLTQRQERRKQPSLLTHATMDSWDFSASLPSSPTTSVFGRQPRPRSAVPPGSVFEIEDSEGGDERGPSLDTGALPVEDTGDDAALEGHSKAEAYVQQVRAQHRSGHSRGLLARSCSGSSQSIHAARRHLDDGQHYTIDSIEEGAVAIPAADGYATDGERGDEGLPVVGSSKSAELAMLHVPLAPPPSTSPSGSSRSSGTATSSSSPSGPSTPPQSFLGTAKAQPARLWRKLAGKFDLDADKEKESASGSKPPTPTLKKAFGSVLGRSASRTMSSEYTTFRHLPDMCANLHNRCEACTNMILTTFTTAIIGQHYPALVLHGQHGYLVIVTCIGRVYCT